MSLTRDQSLVLGVIFALAVSAAGQVGWSGLTSGLEVAIVPPEAAAYWAIEYARPSFPGGAVGRLIGGPTEIRGEVMTYGQAEVLLFGRLPDPESADGQRVGELVWLVEVRGEREALNSASGYEQVVVVLDAYTADPLQSTAGPVGREFDLTSLSVLESPIGPVPTPSTRSRRGKPVIEGPTPTPAPTSTPSSPQPRG